MRFVSNSGAIALAAFLSAAAHAALIDIGSNPQLFVDEYILESITGAERVLNPAQKVDGNPVISRTEPWEGNAMVLRYAEYDEKSGLFRLWYNTSNIVSIPISGPTSEDLNEAGDGKNSEEMKYDLDYDGGANYYCYATSKDGIHWDKPNLGLFEFEGSTENNIIPPDNDIHKIKFFTRDDHATDPARRYWGMERFQTYDEEIVNELANSPDLWYRMEDKWADQLKEKNNWGSIGYNLYFSPDGLEWTPYEGNPILRNAPQQRWWAGPMTTMGWDPIREVYAIHMEATQHSRSTYFARLIGRSESKDLVDWTYPETIVVPDEKDPPGTQFYRSPVIAYAGVYLMIPNNYNTETGEIFGTFASSRDGIRYDRTFREPLIPLGKGRDFDALEMYPREPILHNDTMYIYYYGRVSGHGHGFGYDEPITKDDTYSAIGLATLPMDGFVSIDAPPREDAIVMTRSFEFTGDELYLRAKGGSVKVQLLAGAHHMIPGHTFEDADPVPTTGKMERVTWNEKSDLSHLEGKPVKLKIQLNGSKLYSFQFK